MKPIKFSQEKTSRLSKVILDIESYLKCLKVEEENYRSTRKTKTTDFFKYINVWDSQIDDLILNKNGGDSQGYAFSSPAAFIQIETNEAQKLLMGVTSYPNFRIIIRLYHLKLNDGNKLERNLDIFTIRDHVLSVLKNANISYCSTISLHEETFDYNHGNVYRYTLGFSTNFIDSTGGKQEKEIIGCLVDPKVVIRVNSEHYSNIEDNVLYADPNDNYCYMFLDY